ncbi:HK97 gp10 family phage protein [Porcipelethomonas sp.]|uniref:HK97 gp10 family phage protein n=1 Tax=Porcipelethomonas sp. TaxID=2981675 RepID=UPI003EF1B24A
MIESDDMKNFFSKCSSAGNGDFKRALNTFLEGIGLEFLRVIQDEIIRLKVMDTRLLLSSFHKSDSNGVWELSEGNLTLEVGTNVEYASYVNDGHWTCGKGEKMRFVPGHWNGNRFIYDPSAKTGMMLKQKWVEGRHFWESGIKIMEKMIPGLLDAKVQQWMESYFR